MNILTVFKIKWARLRYGVDAPKFASAKDKSRLDLYVFTQEQLEATTDLNDDPKSLPFCARLFRADPPRGRLQLEDQQTALHREQKLGCV